MVGRLLAHSRARSAAAATAATIAAVSAAATAEGWPGPPKSPPPRHGSGPPPAWAETPARSLWLAFGSYCWATTCADMAPPQSRRDLPLVIAKRGQRLRIHLAFAPRDPHLTLFLGTRIRHVRLRSARILVWRATAAGVFEIDMRGPRGTAAYLARLRMR